MKHVKDNKITRRRRKPKMHINRRGLDKPRSDNRPPKNKRHLTRGHIRKDGMVFWQYMAACKSGEWWVSSEKFESMQQTIRDRRPPSTFVPESKDVQRFKTNLRSRVSHALSRNSKSASTETLVGCSMDELRDHLEYRFTAGMTWDNYGEWHVDHIKPCAMFDFSIDSHQFECFHYTNMQPLWAIDNYKKGIKYEKIDLTSAEQVSELKDLGASEGDLASCKNQKQRKELFRKLTKNKYE